METIMETKADDLADDAFEAAFDGAGDIAFCERFRLDSPDYGMLVVNGEEDFLEHLRAQGAGMAYYTALSKQADREYDEEERKVKFRQNEMFAECSDQLARSGRKATVREIEAMAQSRYQSELAEEYRRLGELRSRRDYIAAFLEGWRQKSYTLSSMTQMFQSGILAPPEAVREQQEDNPGSAEVARRILRKRRESRQQAETREDTPMA